MAVQTETKEQMIKDQLYWDSRVIASDIDINVTDSTAKLSGTVPTYSEKIAAEDDALSVPGILTVESNIQVAFPEEYPVFTDSKIKNSIDNMLLSDTRIDSTKIDVTVDNGIVTLDGYVNSYWKKYTVEDIASRVSGVVGVANNIIVSSTTTYEDSKITSEIKNALRRSSLVNSEDVSVAVQNGMVTLSGHVPDLIAKRTAFDKAAYTAGVIGIDNEMSIKNTIPTANEDYK